MDANRQSAFGAYGERAAFGLLFLGTGCLIGFRSCFLVGWAGLAEFPLVFLLSAYLCGLACGHKAERAMGVTLIPASILWLATAILFRPEEMDARVSLMFLLDGVVALVFAQSLILRHGIHWTSVLIAVNKIVVCLLLNADPVLWPSDRFWPVIIVWTAGFVLTAVGSLLLMATAGRVPRPRPTKRPPLTWGAALLFLLLVVAVMIPIPVFLFPRMEQARMEKRMQAFWDEIEREQRIRMEEEEARRREEELQEAQRAEAWRRDVAAVASLISGSVAGQRKEVSISPSVTMAFRWCPAGSFRLMAPEGYRFDGYFVSFGPNAQPQDVSFVHGFWMGETEVTQGEWKAVMGDEGILSLARQLPWEGANEKPESYCGDLLDNRPVYYVTCKDAEAFCARLSERERQAGRLPNGYAYRLPTSAEWEYACYAGVSRDKGTLPDGSQLVILGKNNAPALGHLAWYAGNATKDFSGRGWDVSEVSQAEFPGKWAAPRAVGTRQANAWGLRDMLGNVREWCGFQRAVDMQPEDGVLGESILSMNVEWFPVRGGSWRLDVERCAPWAVQEIPVTYCSSELGFRVVLAPTFEN